MEKNYSKPFGDISFEYEKNNYGKNWENYFFEHINLLDAFLERDNYLLVGRRGSGKTTFGNFLKFQVKFKKSSLVLIDNFSTIEEQIVHSFESINAYKLSSIENIVNVWDVLIWQEIFKFLKNHSPEFKKVILNIEENKSIVTKIVLGIIDKFIIENPDEIIDDYENEVKKELINDYKNKALEYFKDKNLFIYIDSKEKYSIHNELEMSIISALIQFVSIFNSMYATKNIQIKIGISDEIFPALKEKFISNTLKYIRNPLYLYWKPKDLLKLISWRYYKFLTDNNIYSFNFYENDIDWDNYEDIYKKIWLEFFPEYIINKRNKKEKTFQYILRHTQLRPRQLVLLCNHIAKKSVKSENFPKYTSECIIDGISECEVDLSDELLNSYEGIYQNCGNIIGALEGMPIEFKFSEIHKIYRRTLTFWNIKASKSDFERLVVELGIIGRKMGETNKNAGIIKAVYEYSINDRLYFNENDICVIHPMFYRKLNINKDNPIDDFVYPFPDTKDFSLLDTL